MTEYGVTVGEVRDVSNSRIDVNTNQNRLGLHNSFCLPPKLFCES
jgi:hypothetical protein